MPDPVPVIVLGRLAGDQTARRLKLETALLLDAVTRSEAVAQNAGVRALWVHALHDDARRFYEHCGFQISPLQPTTRMLRLHPHRTRVSARG